MTDEDLEMLHRLVDGELSADEAAELEARLETSPALAGERAELMQLSAMLRQDISTEVDAVDFSNFYAGIEAQLPDEVFAPSVVEEPAPIVARRADESGLMDRVRAWFQRSWTPLMVGAAAAAAVALWIVQAPTESQPNGGEVYVEAAKANGARTTLVGLPAEKTIVAAAETPPESGPVYVDAVSNQGTKTVLISMPADESGATVIWLLDEEDEDTQLLEGEDPI